MSYNIEPIHVDTEYDELIDEFYAADLIALIRAIFDHENDLITLLTAKRMLEESIKEKRLSVTLYDKLIKKISDKQ